MLVLGLALVLALVLVLVLMLYGVDLLAAVAGRLQIQGPMGPWAGSSQLTGQRLSQGTKCEDSATH
jgi:hypothetical protein